MPKCGKQAIFVQTTTTTTTDIQTDYFTPCACARGNKQSSFDLPKQNTIKNTLLLHHGIDVIVNNYMFPSLDYGTCDHRPALNIVSVPKPSAAEI